MKTLGSSHVCETSPSLYQKVEKAHILCVERGLSPYYTKEKEVLYRNA